MIICKPQHQKIATIVPLNHLERIRDDAYFMSLSYLMDHPAYLNFFREVAREGRHVIMDNSAVELGKPEDLTSYLRKAVNAEVSEIMVPDFFEDSARTLWMLDQALERIKAFCPGRVQVMAIPQGKTVEEWKGCAFAMTQTSDINTLGISCRYTEMFGGSRKPAIDALIDIFSTCRRHDIRIHLLGCYGDLEEEAKLLEYDLVKGMDSSYPCVFTAHELFVRDERSRPKDRGIDFLADLYNVDIFEANLAYWWEVTCTYQIPLGI